MYTDAEIWGGMQGGVEECRGMQGKKRGVDRGGLGMWRV